MGIRIKYKKDDPRAGTEVELDDPMQAAKLVAEGKAEYLDPAQAAANDRQRAEQEAIERAEQGVKAAEVAQTAADMAAATAAHRRTAQASADAETAEKKLEEAKAGTTGQAKASSVKSAAPKSTGKS